MAVTGHMTKDQVEQQPDAYIGTRRLLGDSAWGRLRSARVGVVGVGGVGSWAAEMLVRSGVAKVTLIDLDDVCITNVNRQLQALPGTVGRLKVEVLAQRLRSIAPDCEVRPVAEYFTAASAERHLAWCPDGVVDAIDSIRHKTELVAACHRQGLPVVVAGAAGGRRDPCRLRCNDLARASHDPLLRELRKRLRRQHGFPADGEGAFGIAAIHSDEPPGYPDPDRAGGVCDRLPAGARVGVACDATMGSAGYVTAAFGMAAAARLVEEITAMEPR